MKIPPRLSQQWTEGRYPPKPCTLEEIEAIEDAIGKAIPDDYADFLKNFGLVGYSSRIDALDSIALKYKFGEDVKEFIGGIEYLMGCEKALRAYKILSGDSPHFDAGPRIPPDMLPIGENGNNVFLLDLSEKNYGAVWYWEGIEETWGSEGNSILGYVARSFTDFLNSLDTEENVEQSIVHRGGEPIYK